jgi:hypothetical protein
VVVVPEQIVTLAGATLIMGAEAFEYTVIVKSYVRVQARGVVLVTVMVALYVPSAAATGTVKLMFPGAEGIATGVVTSTKPAVFAARE